jgi:hypothetical protein
MEINKMASEPSSQLEHPERNHPAYETICLAAKQASRMRGSLLEDLFRLSISKQDEWIHWSIIRDITFKDVKREKTTKSDNVTKLGNELKAFLEDWTKSNPMSEWTITLQSKIFDFLDRSKHWKLIVMERNRQKGSKVRVSTAPATETAELFVPEFKWEVNDFKRRIPVWLPYDPKFELDFFVNVCSE